MAVMLVARYEVSDLDRFLEAFDGFEATRRSGGATATGLVRSLDDPRTLVALIEFASREAAEAFATSAERTRTLEGAGVTSRTDELMEVVRAVATA